MLACWLAVACTPCLQPPQASASGAATPASRLLTPLMQPRHRYSSCGAAGAAEDDADDTCAANGTATGAAGAALGGCASLAPVSGFKHLPIAVLADALDMEHSNAGRHWGANAAAGSTTTAAAAMPAVAGGGSLAASSSWPAAAAAGTGPGTLQQGGDHAAGGLLGTSDWLPPSQAVPWQSAHLD